MHDGLEKLASPRGCACVAAFMAAVLTGCFGGGDGGPSSPTAPTDTVAYEEDRGRLIAQDVREYTNGLLEPNWVFLGNEREIAYATQVGGGRLWFRDLDAAGPVELIRDLGVVQDVHYAPDEGRIYVGKSQAIISVDPDGTDAVTLTDDNWARVRISSDGRYLLHTRSSDNQTELVDRVMADTVEVDREPAFVRMFDDYAVFPTGLGTSELGVGVWDLATGDTALTTGFQASFSSPAIVDIGGHRDSPRFTVIDATGGARVVTFTGDAAAGTGATSESLFIPPDSVWADPYDNVKGAASPDGSRIAVSVLRDYLSGCYGSPCRFRWDILLVDVTADEVSVIAYGVSKGEPTGMVFSPAGSRLLYETEGQLYLVDLP